MQGLFSRVTGLFKSAVQAPEEKEEPSEHSGDDGDDDDEVTSSGTRLFAAVGQLYRLRGNKYKPVLPIGELQVLSLVQRGDTAFEVSVADEKTRAGHLSQAISEAMQLRYCAATGSVHWNTSADGEDVLELAFRFASSPKGPTPAALAAEFVDLHNKCLYSALTGVAFSAGEQADDDFSYVASTFASEIPVEDEETIDKKGGTAAAQPTRGVLEPEDTAEYDFTNGARVSTGAGVNQCFADSVLYNRAIVIKGDPKGGADATTLLQAYSYDERGFSAAGAQQFSLGDKRTERLAPKDALLTHGDRKMMILDSAAQAEAVPLAEVDLERGQILQRYGPGLDFTVTGISQMDKFGGKDPHLITCINRTAAFTIDTRLDPKKCAVVESGKELSEYTHKPKAKADGFTCHATSARGHLAVGDSRGVIRLFTGPPGSRRLDGKGHYPKTAKTLLRGTPNEPILHLDITADGGYILATCPTFLLVLCTRYLDDKSREQNGFEGRMGNSKPMPLKLTLSAEQQTAVAHQLKTQKQWAGRMPNFTRGTFEGNTNGENWIASSCGPFVLTWSMAAVKRALECHRAVYSDAKDEGAPIKEVAMNGDREVVTFMTEGGIGMEHHGTGGGAAKGPKVCFRFSR